MRFITRERVKRVTTIAQGQRKSGAYRPQVLAHTDGNNQRGTLTVNSTATATRLKPANTQQAKKAENGIIKNIQSKRGQEKIKGRRAGAGGKQLAEEGKPNHTSNHTKCKGAKDPN